MAAKVAASVALMSAALLGACASAHTAEYNDALTSWNARQYAKALTTARSAQDSAQKAGDAEVRDKSAYLAGLAAYQLGRMDDASRSFSSVATSSDAELAGNATAMQGAVALEQGRWSDAAVLYTKAAGMLKGKNAEEARALATAAEERARGRRSDSAAPARAVASGTAKESAQSSTSAKNSTGGSAGSGRSSTTAAQLTIVAGTFSSEVAARQRAGTLAEAAKRAGLSPPKVVPASAPGKRVWIVEVGVFTDRAKAEAALKKLPIPGGVVASSQGR
jgi:tetratricopeptide (TPR) repeat protein